jgi:hypothetical protein
MRCFVIQGSRVVEYSLPSNKEREFSISGLSHGPQVLPPKGNASKDSTSSHLELANLAWVGNEKLTRASIDSGRDLFEELEEINRQLVLVNDRKPGEPQAQEGNRQVDNTRNQLLAHLVEDCKYSDWLEEYRMMRLESMSDHMRNGNYADAETALFKALRFGGNVPRSIKAGREFFEFCLTVPEESLKAGNFSKEEVDEGLTELEELASTEQNIAFQTAAKPTDDSLNTNMGRSDATYFTRVLKRVLVFILIAAGFYLFSNLLESKVDKTQSKQESQCIELKNSKDYPCSCNCCSEMSDGSEERALCVRYCGHLSLEDEQLCGQ